MTSVTSPTTDADRAILGAPLTMWGLIVLLASFLPVNMTFGAMNLLAPAIGTDLHASPAEQQLVLSGYTATFTASLVIAGRLGDRFGRRRVLATGLAGFAVVCAASTIAPSTGVLILLRCLLGVSAGLVMPQILATIHATASPRLRTFGVAGFAVIGALSTIVGQLTAGAAGAVLDTHVAWRVAQIVIAGVALGTLALLGSVPPSRSEAPLDLDVTGGITIGAGLLLVIFPLTLGPALGWPVWSIAALGAGLGCGALFWRLQHRAEGQGRLPSIPPSLMRSHAMSRGAVMVLVFSISYGAFLFTFSGFAQHDLGLSAPGAALLVLPFGLSFLLTSIAVPRITGIVGSPTMTLAGLAQAGVLVAIAVTIATGNADPWTLQPLLVLLGVAQAVMYGPLVGAVVAGTPTWAAGLAGGVVAAAMQLGLTLGVALLGGLGTTNGATGVSIVVGIQALLAISFASLAPSVARASGEQRPGAAAA